MRQVCFGFALFLLFITVGEASPISDDEMFVALRYPKWWRPSEEARSFWDPLIARLIWTHPALRRYYKELAGWESSHEESLRPSLLDILNEYDELDRSHEEHRPIAPDNYKEDPFDLEHSGMDRPDEEYKPITPDNNREDGLEHTELNMDQEETQDHEEQNFQVEDHPKVIRDGEDTVDEAEPATKKRRSVHSKAFGAENRLLPRTLLARLVAKSRLDQITRSRSDGISQDTTVGELFDAFGFDSSYLVAENINVDDKVVDVDMDSLKRAVNSAVEEMVEEGGIAIGVNVDVSSVLELVDQLLDRLVGPDGLVPDVLESLGNLLGNGQGGIGGLVGGLLGGNLQNRQPFGSFNLFSNRHFAAFGGRVAKREEVKSAAASSPAARILDKLHLDNVNLGQLLNDLEMKTVHVRARSADADCTTEESSFVREHSQLEERKKRSLN